MVEDWTNPVSLLRGNVRPAGIEFADLYFTPSADMMRSNPTNSKRRINLQLSGIALTILSPPVRRNRLPQNTREVGSSNQVSAL